MKENLLAQAVNFNQLNQTLSGLGFKFTNSNLGEIISAVLPYIYVIAGLILFVYLIWGGFELLTSAGNPDKMKAAQGKITGAVVGFLIIFVAYWVAQILEVIFNISILG